MMLRNLRRKIRRRVNQKGNQTSIISFFIKQAAVFTYGAWINNRSLFPCQEPPIAMATWEATVSVNNSAIVLMSGDEDAAVAKNGEATSFYYFTKSVLPMSTLCLAVGFWNEHVICSKYSRGPKCRIFSPPSLFEKAVQEFFEYVPYCLKISDDIFGPYPFPRIDFLVVPPTFGSLGMASPNIVFLSQSLLAGDSSMCSRVAHEIAHGWFGLLIGASDWTEEWLSEGFATFVEDYLHVFTLNMSQKEANEYIEIKTYIRLKTLTQEIEHTNEDLQVLRASKGEACIQTIDGVDAAILKNGQNPMKAFTQVHYIKGYFLLKHLADLVEISNFLTFLRHYIQKYKGKLVTSVDFLNEFFTYFPFVDSLNMEQVCENWLHNSGIPTELKKLKPSPHNDLYTELIEQTKKWKRLNQQFSRSRKKKIKPDLESFSVMTAEQQILFLENMLLVDKISFHTLKCMLDVFKFHTSNAEVQHRWLELVVKFKYRPCYNLLEQFLSSHLAMGVYLFGEMLFSNNHLLTQMAEEQYASLRPYLEPNYITTIEEMFENLKNK